MERKIEHFVEQQSLFKLMRDDLENYKKIADMSKELATYYSPFTPLHQYKKEILIKLPQIKSEIIDLKGAMHETSSTIETLNKRIKELQSANSEMKFKSETSINKVQTLQGQLSEYSKINLDEIKKTKEEYVKLKEKLEKAETGKVMIEKKFQKIEGELKEYQNISKGQNETIKNLMEQKVKTVYVEKQDIKNLDESLI